MITITQRLPRTILLLQNSNPFLLTNQVLPSTSVTLLSKRNTSASILRTSLTSQKPSPRKQPPQKSSPKPLPKPSKPSQRPSISRAAAPPTTFPKVLSPQATPSSYHPNDTPPSKVNGPLSTLPAPLSVPSRQPTQGIPSYLFSIGKSYLAFYKTGVKNIYTNYRASRPIQHTIDTEFQSSVSKAVKSGGLSRSDFQLLIRNWHDIKRVPIFGLVFCICGEFTPLIVVLVSGVVPWTCRIPKQIHSDRKKMEERRRISFRNLTLPPPVGDKNGVDKLERMQVLHISWSLGLSSSAWDWLGGQLPGLPTLLLKRRVKRRVEYLHMDDKLIKDWGGVRLMSAEEVMLAAVERGIDIIGRGEEDVRGDLDSWLRSREMGSPVAYLLLTRPSVWPSQPQSQLHHKTIKTNPAHLQSHVQTKITDTNSLKPRKIYV